MLLVWLAACDPFRPWPVEPDPDFSEERIAVSPGVLDFGEVSVNLLGDRTLPITVYNLTDADVTLTGHDEPLGDDEFRIITNPLLTLGPHETREIEVSFIPETEAPSFARLRLEPGAEVVDLLGQGRAPVLAVGDVTVAATVLGCSSTATVELSNEGSEWLSLAPSVSGNEYSLLGYPDGLAPGETTSIELAFTPQGGGTREAQLLLETDDPLNPSVVVPVTGLGYAGATVEESWVYHPTAPTDVVLVVQGSASVGDARVPAAVETWLEQILLTESDVHVTAIGSASACPPDPRAWSTTSDSVLLTERILAAAFDAPAGAWDSRLIEVARLALAETDAGDCLAGFRREEANLDVVVVAADLPSGDLDADVAALQDAAGAVNLRVSALVPQSGDCGPLGSDYARIAQSLGGVAADRCAPSWEGAFLSFADLPTVSTSMRYPLATEPVPSSLEVRADGVLLTGWTYTDGVVVIDPPNAPTLGADLDIRYVSAVSCE